MIIPTLPQGRILAVDPGEKRIGLAVSDPLGMIANPLSVLEHISRDQNGQRIAAIAAEKEAVAIVVGLPLNSEGEIGPSAKRSVRLANAIRKYTDTEVILWDESGSTQAAQQAYIQMGVSRKKRRGHLDQIAATVILQSFLNTLNPPTLPPSPFDGDEYFEE